MILHRLQSCADPAGGPCRYLVRRYENPTYSDSRGRVACPTASFFARPPRRPLVLQLPVVYWTSLATEEEDVACITILFVGTSWCSAPSRLLDGIRILSIFNFVFYICPCEQTVLLTFVFVEGLFDGASQVLQGPMISGP